MSKVPHIKNRAPAPIQITAEQILRESQERGLEDVQKAPKQFITDKEELQLYQQTKRKDFEDQLRRQRQHIGIWCRYALWEASQLDFVRTRSVFERALSVDYRNQTLWLKYAEMEMKNKFINHARNIWDRAVTLLPRVDTFWYKFSYMEEVVGAIENARQIFERWMTWEPDDLAWAAYIKFEFRQNEIDKSRAIYERYIKLWPTARAFLKYARWEESLHQRGLARTIYERGLSELHSQEKTENFIIQFARFEERCKEIDRARCIYQYAIQSFEAKQQEEGGSEGNDISELKKEFLLFEKRHGEKQQIEDVILTQRREYYEKQLAKDGYNYDIWFDYVRLEELQANTLLSEGNDESWEEMNTEKNAISPVQKAFIRVRTLYERAIQQVPLIKEKKYWKRYIYLWIQYMLFEELTAKDMTRTRDLYTQCLQLIPHASFTFGKIWLLAAKFEIRQKNVTQARKILGQGIGMCPMKNNLYKGYIQLELQLGEIERCRMLYMKYLSYLSYNVSIWLAFASFEQNLGEAERVRGIYQLATGTNAHGRGNDSLLQTMELDMPEVLWKAYIDFEIQEEAYSKVRNLYEELVARSNHVKVWISYGKYEYELLSIQRSKVEEGTGTASGTETGADIEVARRVFSKGYEAMKAANLKEERVLLLEAWIDGEREALSGALPGSSPDYLDSLIKKQPKKIKMKRYNDETQVEEGYYDYIFPDDNKKLVGMKLLEKALLWKTAAATTTAVSTDSGDSLLGKRSADNEAE